MNIKYEQHGVLLGQRPTDYIAGILPYEINNESGDWTPYIPTEENQYGSGGDRYNCVTQSAQNAIKMLLNERIANKKISVDDLKWLNDNGYIDQYGHVQFSVRFNSITNGTIPGVGNYLYLVGDDLRKTGLIPESLLPDDNSIPEAQYYDKAKITPVMLDLGLQWLSRFKINYEFSELSISGAIKNLKQSPLQAVINLGTHAVCEINQVEDLYTIWDSYPPYQSNKSNTQFPWYLLKYVLTYLNKKTMKLVSSNYDLFIVDEANKFAWSIPNPDALEEIVNHFALIGNPLGAEVEADLTGYYVIHGGSANLIKDFFNIK